MPGEPRSMSLDDLLKRQEQSGRVTIDAITDRPTHVKVTPFSAGASGCQCHASITVPRDFIESVTDTGEVHYCCGKSLSVVTVLWKEKAALPITELLTEAGKRAVATAPGESHHTPYPQMLRSHASGRMGIDTPLLPAGSPPAGRIVPGELYGYDARVSCGPLTPYVCCCSATHECWCCAQPCNYGANCVPYYCH